MHIEIYYIRLRLLITQEEVIFPLCFEVGETDEDRQKLVEGIRKQLDLELNAQEYTILGFVSKRIYPQEE